MKSFKAFVVVAACALGIAAGVRVSQACPDGESQVCDATETRCWDETVCDEWGRDNTCNHYTTVRHGSDVCIHWSCQ